LVVPDVALAAGMGAFTPPPVVSGKWPALGRVGPAGLQRQLAGRAALQAVRTTWAREGRLAQRPEEGQREAPSSRRSAQHAAHGHNAAETAQRGRREKRTGLRADPGRASGQRTQSLSAPDTAVDQSQRLEQQARARRRFGRLFASNQETITHPDAPATRRKSLTSISGRRARQVPERPLCRWIDGHPPSRCCRDED